MGEMMNAGASAVNYRLGATEARVQGAAARSRAYAEAYALEEGARSELEVAGDNMMTLRGNQLLAMAEERARQGSSGFMVSTGSQSAGELSRAEVFEKAIGDLRRGAVVGSRNAAVEATMLRRRGDNEAAMAEVNAAAADKLAKRADRMGPWLGVGQGLQLVGGELGRYHLTMGKETNKEARKKEN